MPFLPKRLRNAPPEEIDAYDTQMRRKAFVSREESRNLFRQRMQREGKLEEFQARVDALRAEGRGYTSAVYAAMREFGFKDVKRERALHKKAVANGMLDRWREGQKKGQRKYRRKMQAKTLIEAFNELPPNAPNAVEMGWVRSHPLMMATQLAALQAREDEPIEAVVPTVTDLENPSNGKCPSKSAFTMLISWLQNPKEFQKQLMPEQRKQGEKPVGDKDKDEVEDTSLAEYEQMLKTVMSAE